MRIWVTAPKSQKEKRGVRRNTKGHTRTDSGAGEREMVAEQVKRRGPEETGLGVWQ